METCKLDTKKFQAHTSRSVSKNIPVHYFYWWCNIVIVVIPENITDKVTGTDTVNNNIILKL